MFKIKVTFTALAILCSANAWAESDCRALAKSMAFDSPSLPLAADKNTAKEIIAQMNDIEILCKAVVRKIKTGAETPQGMTEKANQFVAQAKAQYDKDGDMDEFEAMKYNANIIKASIKIALK